MNESGSAGPALVAAATPVSTKMPVPMMPPMPSSVSCVAVSARRSWLPEDSCSCSSAMDLVARSWLAIEPPLFRGGLYTSDLWKASEPLGEGALRRAPPAVRRRAASGRAKLLGDVRGDYFQQPHIHLG